MRARACVCGERESVCVCVSADKISQTELSTEEPTGAVRRSPKG